MLVADFRASLRWADHVPLGTQLPFERTPTTAPTYRLIERSLRDSRLSFERPGEREAEPDGRAQQPASPQAAQNIDLVCVVANPCIEAAASFFASATARTLLLVQSVDEALQQAVKLDPASVLIFVMVDDLAQDDGFKIATASPVIRLNGIGVVCARSQDEAWAWIMRRLCRDELFAHHRGGLRLDSDERKGSVRLRRGASGADRAGGSLGLTVDSVTRHLAHPRDHALLHYHSRETCGIMDMAVLCGRARSDELRRAPSNAARPSCANGECLWGESERVQASEINAAHIVMLTCSSLRLGNGLIAPAFNLGLDAFSGVCRSLIAPIKFTSVSAALIGFAWERLNGPTTVGKLCRDLNLALLSTGGDRDAFVLLGDPCDAPECLSTEEHSESHFDIVARREAGSPAWRGGQAARKATLAKLTDVTPNDIKVWTQLDAHSSFWLSNNYAEPDFLHVFVRWAQCPTCGCATGLFARSSATKPWRRLLKICIRCGITEDIPKGVGHVQLRAPQRVVTDSTFAIEVATDSRIALEAFGLSISHGTRFGWDDLPIVSRDGASQNQTLQFEVTAPSRAGLASFALRLYYVADGLPGFQSRPIVVDEKL